MTQLIGGEIIRKARNIKMQKLELELRTYILGCSKGERILCPFCNYTSKKNPTSAKVFSDGVFKCFSCGTWRRV